MRHRRRTRWHGFCYAFAPLTRPAKAAPVHPSPSRSAPGSTVARTARSRGRWRPLRRRRCAASRSRAAASATATTPASSPPGRRRPRDGARRRLRRPLRRGGRRRRRGGGDRPSPLTPCRVRFRSAPLETKANESKRKQRGRGRGSRGAGKGARARFKASPYRGNMGRGSREKGSAMRGKGGGGGPPVGSSGGVKQDARNRRGRTERLTKGARRRNERQARE